MVMTRPKPVQKQGVPGFLRHEPVRERDLAAGAVARLASTPTSQGWCTFPFPMHSA